MAESTVEVGKTVSMENSPDPWSHPLVVPLDESTQKNDPIVINVRPHIEKDYRGDGDGPSEWNQNIWMQSHFHQHLNKILEDSKSKIKVEADTMISNFSFTMSSTVQKEKQQHAIEKSHLRHEIDDLHQCVRSLEAIIDIRRNNIEVLIQKFQQRSNLVLCSKVFYSWRLYTENRKKERFLESLAARHYARNLMQKAFSWWLAQLNRNWKNKMELKAHVEMLEVQRRIVDAYEARIQNLEDNLSEAGKKISTLQSRHSGVFNKPSLKPHSLTFNLPSPSTDELFGRTTAIPEKTPLRFDADAVLCSNCSIRGNFVQHPIKCYGCSAVESSCSIHSSKDGEPSIVQPNISMWPLSTHHVCPILVKEKVHVTRPEKWIESHIQSSDELRHSRPTSAKSKQKKTV